MFNKTFESKIQEHKVKSVHYDWVSLSQGFKLSSTCKCLKKIKKKLHKIAVKIQNIISSQNPHFWSLETRL